MGAALGGLTALAVAMPSAHAQNSAVTPTRVVVMDPLTLSKTKDMDFGWVVPPDAGNVTITFDVANGSACAASAGLLRGGECEAAEFVGYGSVGQRIRVRLPARRRVFLTGPGQRMRVNQMDIYLGEGLNRLSPTGRRNQRFRINSADGGFFFRVGGRLRVRANQAPGLYQGTFTVDVEYR